MQPLPLALSALLTWCYLLPGFHQKNWKSARFLQVVWNPCLSHMEASAGPGHSLLGQVAIWPFPDLALDLTEAKPGKHTMDGINFIPIFHMLSMYFVLKPQWGFAEKSYTKTLPCHHWHFRANTHIGPVSPLGRREQAIAWYHFTSGWRYYIQRKTIVFIWESQACKHSTDSLSLCTALW